MELSVQEVQKILAEDPSVRLLDVREDFERAIASLPGSQQLTEQLATEISQRGDRNARYIFMCHHGIRSMVAAQYFAQQGFKNVYSMRGGIQAWSEEIDPEMPMY